MCGIFGYTGTKRDATSAVVEGLTRLDYRGYDSWGIGILKNSKIKVSKHIGKVNPELMKLPQSNMAIGHTRWATNGAVTKLNAHPHWASDKSFILAHNGIVENHADLKNFLVKRGYKFISQTDTEVIVRLIEHVRKSLRDTGAALRKVMQRCEGRNTIIILTTKREIIAARNGSPLVLGMDESNNEIYFSSDTLSFSRYVKKAFTVTNGQMISYKNGRLIAKDINTGETVRINPQPITISDRREGKVGFEHFMLKEIFDEPEVIQNVISQTNFTLLNKLSAAIKKANNIYCIGSGTAGAAALQTAYYLRKFGGIKAVGLLGAEAKEYYRLFNKDDIIISPSQSGETADVLEVLEAARSMGTKIASYVNMPGSLMTSLSDFKFMANSGPEICVMSTKVFLSQLSWGYLLAKNIVGAQNTAIRNLNELSHVIKRYLHNKNIYLYIQKLANQLKNKHDILLMAKGQNLQIAREGMIKIVEGSYIHAHAISAGDLKHYAITLIEKAFPVISIVSDDESKSDTLTSISEVVARGAEIILISSVNSVSAKKWINVPDTGEVGALMNIVPLQLLAYYLSLAKGTNIDKPRNIAKSVTVK